MNKLVCPSGWFMYEVENKQTNKQTVIVTVVIVTVVAVVIVAVVAVVIVTYSSK